VVFHYLFYNGQAYSRTAVFPFTVQAGKHLEDLIGILLLKANAVVLNCNPVVGFPFSTTSFAVMSIRGGMYILFAILQRIADEVLKKLLQLSSVAFYYRQLAYRMIAFFPLRPTLNLPAPVALFRSSQPFLFMWPLAYMGVKQQVINQVAHALRGVFNAAKATFLPLPLAGCLVGLLTG
jgi:hypothetical protein